MSLRKSIGIFTIGLLFALVSLPTSVQAQDLLARQAPVDRKMKAVDTLVLRSIVEREQEQSPAASLYNDWDNRYAHRRTEMPDTFKIDLRHFSMPTNSRVVTSNFGSRWGRQHKGLDIKVYIGDTIRAAFSGKVRIVRYEAEATESISLYDIPMDLRRYMATFQNNLSRKIRSCVQAKSSVLEVIRAAVLAHISTLKHVFVESL